jgi:glycosyltransferase involved in cell wall biosynthesis
MNILYLVHQFFPVSYLGTEKFLLNLSTCLQKWGHTVKVMTYGYGENSFSNGRESGFRWKKYTYKGIPVVGFKQLPEPPNLHWNIENPALVKFAEQMLTKERPDLLHIAHGMRVSSVAIAAQRLGIPYVVTLTDFFFLCPKCKLFTSKGTLCAGPEKGESCKNFCPEFDNDVVRNRLKLSEKILRGARSVVAPSKFLGSLFKREFPWLTPKVIPYGVDFSKFRQNTRVFDGKEHLVVLYAGQIDYHKGVHILIEAIQRINSEKIVAKMYGTGPYSVEANIRKLAKNDPRIQFCGVYSEENIGDVFSSVDCVVVPSLWHENNTIVMREAFAAHVPVIVSNAGGMTEMVQEGKNGFVFAMGDVEQLKSILERFIASPEMLAAMKKNVSSYHVTTVEQEAYAYEEVYKIILQKKT